ncbi:hypothetical protein G7Y79_00046g082290 [Physcia stellaris]|nr:hypothetical protein G7Y79_00046g082290 [Physcia stellaris]
MSQPLVDKPSYQETFHANEQRMSTNGSTSTSISSSRAPGYDDSPPTLYFTPDGLPPKPLTPGEILQKERRHERETLRVLLARNGLPLPGFIENESLDRPSPLWDLGMAEQIVTYHRALRDSETTRITSLLTSPYNCVEDMEPPSEAPACGLTSSPSSSPNSLDTKNHLTIQFDGSKLESAYPSDPEAFRRQRLHERESLRHSLAKQGFPLPEMIEKEDLSQPSHLWCPSRVEAIARYHREIRDSKTTVLLSSPYYSYTIPKPQKLPDTGKRTSDSPPPDAKRRRTETVSPQHEDETLLLDNTNSLATGEEVHQVSQPTIKVPTAAEIGREVRRRITNAPTRKPKMTETFINRRPANAEAHCELPEDSSLLSAAEIPAMKDQASKSEDHLKTYEGPDSIKAEDNTSADAEAPTPHENIPSSTLNERDPLRAPYDHVVGFPPERPAEAEQNKIHVSWPEPFRGHSSIVGAYATLQEEDSHNSTILEPEANLDGDKHEVEENVNSSKDLQSRMASVNETEQVVEKSKSQDEIGTDIKDLDREAEECHQDSQTQDNCLGDETDAPAASTSGSYTIRPSDWEVVEEIVIASLDVATSTQQYEVELLDEDEGQARVVKEETPSFAEFPTYPAADDSLENTTTEIRSPKKSGRKDGKYETLGKGVQSSRVQKASLRKQKKIKEHTSLKAIRLERACAI